MHSKPGKNRGHRLNRPMDHNHRGERKRNILSHKPEEDRRRERFAEPISLVGRKPRNSLREVESLKFSQGK